MLRLISVPCLALAISGLCFGDRDAGSILDASKSWEFLGQGYQLTADSAVDKNGNVYFTDAGNNRILKIDLDGQISVWKKQSNGTHGVAFGADGRLYGGQHDRKRLVAFSPDGVETVVAEDLQTHHLTVTSRNEVYCAQAPAHRVWLVDAAGKKRIVHEGIEWPRGIHVNADRSVLAVGDAKSEWVWRFGIQQDGSLVDGRPFYRLESAEDGAAPDAGGMDFDSQGWLYVATQSGVQVLDLQAHRVAIIDVPGGGAAGVFFGGSGRHWLYVTDGNKIYRRLVKRKGAG